MGWRSGMGRQSTLSLLGLRDGSSFSGCESGEDGSSCLVGTHVFFLCTHTLSLSLSLSLSLGVCESGNHLKVRVWKSFEGKIQV